MHTTVKLFHIFHNLHILQRDAPCFPGVGTIAYLCDCQNVKLSCSNVLKVNVDAVFDKKNKFSETKGRGNQKKMKNCVQNDPRITGEGANLSQANRNTITN